MVASAPAGEEYLGEYAQQCCTSARKRGVLLINLGTPDQPDTQSVRRYLAEFLSDPYVIKIPPWLLWMN